MLDSEELEEGISEEEEEWGISNHRLICGTYKTGKQKDTVQKVVDWDGLKETIKSV